MLVRGYKSASRAARAAGMGENVGVVLSVELPKEDLAELFPAKAEPCALEVSLMRTIPCKRVAPNTMELRFTREYLDAVAGYLTAYEREHPRLRTNHPPLEAVADALNHIHCRVFYVLVRHTPGKNMRVATVGVRLAEDGSLAVACVWNGYSCECHGAYRAARKFPAIEALTRLVDRRCQPGFWDVGASVNAEIADSQIRCQVNMWTYCTLMPFLYCTIGFAHRLLGTQRAPRCVAMLVFGLAGEVARAQARAHPVFARLVLTMAAGHDAGLNVACPTDEQERGPRAGLLESLRDIEPCTVPEGGSTPEDAMRRLDAKLAIANKLLIEGFDDDRMVYRNDNCGEDISVVFSQWAHGGAGAPELWAKRDCEDCAQVFVQLCNSAQPVIAAHLAASCAHLTVHIDLLRVTYLHDGKPIQHTLTGVLYSCDAWCEFHLCENTSRQYIETGPSDDALLRYLFTGSGCIRKAAEASEHYRCLQWFGAYMVFVAPPGGAHGWHYGATSYTRFAGPPAIVRTLEDARAVSARGGAPVLVLLDPLLYLSQRAALAALIPSRTRSWERMPEAWAQAAGMAGLAEQLYPKIHHFYNENTKTTRHAARAAVAALRERVAGSVGADSPWLGVFDRYTSKKELNLGSIKAHSDSAPDPHACRHECQPEDVAVFHCGRPVRHRGGHGHGGAHE